MLHSLAAKLNQLSDVDAIGEAITTELRELVDYHNCRVFLLGDDGETLAPVAFKGELLEYQGETFDVLITKVGEGITGHIAEARRSYYAPDASNDPYAITIPGTPDVDESIMGVPLIYSDQLVGVVVLSKLGVDQFDLDDLRVLEVLGSHAAVALQNARLLQAERAAKRTSEELLHLSERLTAVTDVPGVLEAALASIPALIQCDGLSAYACDFETGEFRLLARQEGATDQAPPARIPPDVAAEFLLSVEDPFVLSREIVATIPDPYLALRPREVLVAPLRWEPEGLGALVIPALEGARFETQTLHLARGITDITSLALGNAARFQGLEESAARLRALDEMKNMFLDAVSHELRTPLSVVLGVALTLRRGDVDLTTDEAEDLLSRLVSNARKLDRLLEDLLDLDRVARGIAEPSLTEANVADLVRDVMAGVETLDSRRVHAELAPVVVEIDVAKVERIVENLLANAVRHTPEGSRVWVSVTPRAGGALISVEDEGDGVPEELKRAIFDPFRQGPSRHKHAPGVGIGLSLVARFAELHGGRAWVEDRGGGGAAFRVFLPGSNDRSAVDAAADVA